MRLSKCSEHMCYGLFGLFMGLVLSASGFSNFTEVHNMFTFRDFRLLLIFAGAVAIAMVFFFFMPGMRGQQRKRFNKGTIPGAILFGWGWAMTGACPSVVLVQLGEGQLAAVWTLFGILTGVWVYRGLSGQVFKLDTGVCGEE